MPQPLSISAFHSSRPHPADPHPLFRPLPGSLLLVHRSIVFALPTSSIPISAIVSPRGCPSPFPRLISTSPIPSSKYQHVLDALLPHERDAPAAPSFRRACLLRPFESYSTTHNAATFSQPSFSPDLLAHTDNERIIIITIPKYTPPSRNNPTCLSGPPNPLFRLPPPLQLAMAYGPWLMLHVYIYTQRYKPLSHSNPIVNPMKNKTVIHIKPLIE